MEKQAIFFIKIQCPEDVAIFKFHLRGRSNAGVGRIYNWRLEGSTDNTTWPTLYSATGVYISTSKHVTNSDVNTVNKYIYFWIYVVNAENHYLGLTMFQLYNIDDLV